MHTFLSSKARAHLLLAISFESLECMHTRPDPATTPTIAIIMVAIVKRRTSGRWCTILPQMC